MDINLLVPPPAGAAQPSVLPAVAQPAGETPVTAEVWDPILAALGPSEASVQPAPTLPGVEREEDAVEFVDAAFLLALLQGQRTQGANLQAPPVRSQAARVDDALAERLSLSRRRVAAAVEAASALPDRPEQRVGLKPEPLAIERADIPGRTPATETVLREPLPEPLRLAPQVASPPQVADAQPERPLERTLHLAGPQARWGEQMLQALRESVELQLGQRSQSARLRLEPAELGSLDIVLRQEGGQLSVQIAASQGDVARLLQQGSERLRMDLAGQQGLPVSVSVFAEGGFSQSDRDRRGRDEAAHALAIHANPLDTHRQDSRQPGRDDVLATV
ncbi:flagellar hook-length control protein FliK [Metapseudomonas otitidis]|uniref:flagellar hook-length control protein FliK n=1 Tax=Metapseudomonas otitidis TaxID=319939 RepID=UPI0013F67966|nr:flagellar hook-length control protein FliK [Pseudomonas otitidis]